MNTASGASWVSVHHGGGVGIGKSIHAGMVVVAEGIAGVPGAGRAGAHQRPGQRRAAARGRRLRDRRRGPPGRSASAIPLEPGDAPAGLAGRAGLAATGPGTCWSGGPGGWSPSRRAGGRGRRRCRSATGWSPGSARTSGCRGRSPTRPSWTRRRLRAARLRRPAHARAVGRLAAGRSSRPGWPASRTPAVASPRPSPPPPAATDDELVDLAAAGSGGWPPTGPPPSR